MKKLVIYLLVIAALFTLLYYVNQLSQKANEKENVYGKATLQPATTKLLDDPNYQNIILPAQLNDKIKSKEDFFVYFFAADCPHCIATTPVVAPLAKQLGIDLAQYNLLEFREGWSEYQIESTPTLVYYKDGVAVDSMVGGVPVEGSTEGYTVEDFEQFMTKHNAS